MLLRVRRESGQVGLLALVVGVALIAIIAAVVWTKMGHQQRAQQPMPLPTTARTVPGQALEQGSAVECISNLRSIRQAIEMSKATDEAPPPSLSALSSSGITPSMLSCPVSHRPYQYDPRTGRVWCTTPGHERF